MRSGTASPVRRLIAALLIVVFPAMTTSMALPAPLDHGSAALVADCHHPGSGHDGSHHSAEHRPCCDCAAACAGTVALRTPALPAAAPLVVAFTAVPVAGATLPPTRTPHLLPPPLGPPARSV